MMDCRRLGSMHLVIATKLRVVEFHEGLQKIGSHAFYNCISLSSIHFPLLLLKLTSGHLNIADN